MALEKPLSSMSSQVCIQPIAAGFVLADHAYEPKDVHLVAKAGIARTFQNIRLFADMTALENVMVARHVRTHSGLLDAIFRTKAFTQEEKEITEKAHDLLTYVGIDALADVKARTLRAIRN
jgi:branched-chain amino acid transport system ATP-binding protein